MTSVTLPCERTVFHDDRTGREVWKMTSWDDCHCVGPYYYMQPYSLDEKYLVFISDRSGRWELYRLEIESGEATQITDHSETDAGPPYWWNFNFHPNGRDLYFLDGGTACMSNIETLEIRPVVEPPAGWKMNFNGPCFTRDGKYMFTCFADVEQRLNIVSVETKSGTMETVYRWPHQYGNGYEINHLQVAPTEELMLTFNPLPDRQNFPDASREERARYFKIDVATGNAEPFLVMPPGFRATHGFWGTLASGEPRLFFHKKTVPTWTPTSLASVNTCGEDLQEHYISDTLRLGHSELSPDGKILVTDVVDPYNNQMIAVDMETGSSEVLCWPDSSVEQSEDGIQYGHVHLLFSPNGRKILYTSDKTGKAAVYVLPME